LEEKEDIAHQGCAIGTIETQKKSKWAEDEKERNN
jgi:hypothetical protein